MSNILYGINNLRYEISFKSFDQLRVILSFYRSRNINKVNIACKKHINKDFLLDAIKISRNEFYDIDIIPHFSIQHQFRNNRSNTLTDLIDFISFCSNQGCKEVLIVSGSQKRATLDTSSALNLLRRNNSFSDNVCSLGVAFNPFLPGELFDKEIQSLKYKLESGLVNSIWIQFGTDIKLLKNEITYLRRIINLNTNKSNNLKIKMYGSILIPSSQVIARFKFRPWKGVYISENYLNSLDYAYGFTRDLIKVYFDNNIFPLIETECTSIKKLEDFYRLMKI